MSALAVTDAEVNVALDAYFDGDCERPHYPEHMDDMRRALEAAAELRKGEAPMLGRMVEADFSQSTITFEMRGDYVAAAGLYEIRAAAPAPARTDEGDPT